MIFTTRPAMRGLRRDQRKRVLGPPSTMPRRRALQFVESLESRRMLTAAYDWNDDLHLNVSDIDLLRNAILAGNGPTPMDVNGDSHVDTADLRRLIEDTFHTFLGDANLDGQVDRSDLTRVIERLGMIGEVSWADGDFNADGQVSPLDLSILQQHLGSVGIGLPFGGSLVRGDFDANGTLTASDVDALIQVVAEQTQDQSWDLNEDGFVNRGDVTYWITELYGTSIGDANLDGKVNRQDLAIVTAHLGQSDTPSWTHGNFNGDRFVDALDLSILQRHLGFSANEVPILRTRSETLGANLSSLATQLPDWSRLFDLNFLVTPPQGPAEVAAGQAPLDLPLVFEQLGTELGLANRLDGILPTFNASGAPAVLRSELQQAGYIIERFPGGPEGGPDNTELRVRFQQTLTDFAVTSIVNRSSFPPMHGLHPQAIFSGTMDYDSNQAPTSLVVDFVVGIDADGFYLLGQSAMSLQVDAHGAVTGGHDLPIVPLAIGLDGSADASYVVASTIDMPARKVRSDELSDPLEELFTVDVQGSASVTLDYKYEIEHESTRYAITDNRWTASVVDAVVLPTESELTTPSRDQFVQVVGELYDSQVRHLLSSPLRATFDLSPLPFTDDLQPVYRSNNTLLAGDDALDQRASLFDAVIDALSQPLKSLDERGQGLYYASGDSLMGTAAFREQYGFAGEGMTVGVISDGLDGAEFALALGDLPDGILVDRDGSGKIYGEGRHGTAMLEIVHDLAPHAELAFSGTADRPRGLSSAIEWLVETVRADVIVIDPGQLAPGTQPDTAEIILREYLDGTRTDPFGNPFDPLIVIGAGDSHQTTYRDTTRPQQYQLDNTVVRLHEFERVDSSPSPLLPVTLPAGTRDTITLSWITNAGEGLELLAYAPVDPQTPVVTGETGVLPRLNVEPIDHWNEQEGLGLHAITFENQSLQDQLIYLAVKVQDEITSEAESSFLIQGEGAATFGEMSHDTIARYASIPEVLTVGAIDFPIDWDLEAVPETNEWHPADYSNQDALTSQTPLPGDVTVGLDIAALDRATVSGVGTSGFVRGTSVAASYVAGAAALLKSLRPNATSSQLQYVIQSSATDVVHPTAGLSAGYDHRTGFGRVDALLAASQLVTLVPPAGVIAPIDVDDDTESLIERLSESSSYSIVVVDQTGLESMLRGENVPSTELVQVHQRTTPADATGVAFSYQVNVGEYIAALADTDVTAELELSAHPDIELVFGLDQTGFYLGADSVVGARVEGAIAGAGALNAIEVRVGGEVSLTPQVRLAPWDGNADGRIRIHEILQHLEALRPDLADSIKAELTTDLVLEELDFVDVDVEQANDPFHHGDPFVLRGFVSAEIDSSSTEDAVRVSVTDWGLRNPDINVDDIEDYTSSILAQNLIRMAQNQLNRPGGIFGPDGSLVELLQGLEIPLVGGTLGELLPIDLLPTFDSSGLGSVGDIAAETLANIEVIDILSFDAINAYFRTGALPAGSELLRLKVNLDGIDLGFVEQLQAELGALLPDAIDPTGLVRIENARLTGAIVVGFDLEQGPYLVVQDDTGPAQDVTQVGVTFDAIADLSGLPLSNDLLLLDQARVWVSPTFQIIPQSTNVKLRFQDLLAGNVQLNTDFNFGAIQFAANRAALFPNDSDATFRGSVEGLRGTVELSGAFDLAADRVALEIGGALEISANRVAFGWDPAEAGDRVTIARLNDGLLAFPALPNLPRTTIDGLEIEYAPASSTFHLDLDRLTVALADVASSPLPVGDGPARADTDQPIERPLILIPTMGATRVPVEGHLVLPGQSLLEDGTAASFSNDLAAQTYQSLLATLHSAGYSLGEDLFVAHYDWRLPLAPDDNTRDGFLSDVNASMFLPETPINYAIEYVGYWMQQAQDAWAANHGGELPSSVDIIGHGMGGILGRAYFQSNAPYEVPLGVTGLPGALHQQVLPVGDRLILLGTPSEGVPAQAAASVDQWLGNDVQNALVAPTANAAFQRLKTKGAIVGPQGTIELASVVDPDTNEPDPIRFLQAFLLSAQSLQPTYEVVLADTKWPRVVEPIAAQPIPADRSLRWQILTDVNPATIELFVSTSSDGLFPQWENGVDLNGHRVYTETVSPVGGDAEGIFEVAIPNDIRLTSGQEYYWGVRVVDQYGNVDTDQSTFVAPAEKISDTNLFPNVTLITHDRQVPFAHVTVQQDYLEMAQSLARVGDGIVLVYQPSQGVWTPLVPTQSPEVALRSGKSLVLVADWARESAIGDSGFAEAAADAIFASLVELNDQVALAAGGGDPILQSPLHLIGLGRGSVVNTEISQRLGIHFGGLLNDDFHVTTLDPPNDSQPSLNISASHLLELVQEYDQTVFDNIYSFFEDATSLVPFRDALIDLLSGTTRIPYGDLQDPEVVTWPHVSFADNYWQAAADERLQDNSRDTDEISFTMNGREVMSADLNRMLADGYRDRVNGNLAGEPDLSGFAEDNRNGPHLAVKAWYAGTMDLSITTYPSRGVVGEWKPAGKPGATIIRRLGDLPQHTTNEFNLPWYNVTTATVNGWEGNGVGWYYSALGGGKGDRPDSTAQEGRVSITYDNSQRTTLTDSERTAIPSVLNGHFDISTTPVTGRFPTPAPFTNVIPDLIKDLGIVEGLFSAYQPSHLEIPGWSFQGGGNADGGNELGHGQQLVYLIDAVKFVDAARTQIDAISPNLRDATAQFYGSLEEIPDDVNWWTDEKVSLFDKILDGLEGRWSSLKRLRRLGGILNTVIEIPSKLADVLGVDLTTYFTEWAADIQQLREDGLLDQVFKVNVDASLRHNRMLFPAGVTDLVFDYFVTQPDHNDQMLIAFYDSHGNEIVRSTTGEIFTRNELTQDRPFTRFAAQFVDLSVPSNRFQTASVAVPEMLRGKVGSFGIVPISGGAALGTSVFTAEILVDNFRLVDDQGCSVLPQVTGRHEEPGLVVCAAGAASTQLSVGQPSAADGAPLSSSATVDHQEVEAEIASGALPTTAAPPALLTLTNSPAFRNSLLLDLNAFERDASMAVSAPGAVPLPYPAAMNTTVLYGVSTTTTTVLRPQVGPSDTDLLFGMTDLTGRQADENQSWLIVERTANSGDGWVPAQSAIAPFVGVSGVSLLPISQGNDAGSVGGIVTSRPTSHVDFLAIPQVQMRILDVLGRSAELPQQAPSTVSLLPSNAMTMLHDGVDVTLRDSQQQMIYNASDFGTALVDDGRGTEFDFELTGKGDPYYVQTRSVSGLREGGVTQTGVLEEQQTTTFGWQLQRLFDGIGIEGLLELAGAAISVSLEVSIGPNGVEFGPDSSVEVTADYAALFPNAETTTDPANPESTLDGLISVIGFEGQIDLLTGAFDLQADQASVAVEGIFTATATAIPDPIGAGTLPAIEFHYDPSATNPKTVVGALRGLAVGFEFLGDDIPSNLVQVQEIVIRRDGFSIDGSIGDPTAEISFGGEEPIVQLTGLQGQADLDVTFVPQFAVAGTVGISVQNAQVFPGSTAEASLSNALLSIDVRSGATELIADEFRFEIGDLLEVVATKQGTDPLRLDIGAALTDPTLPLLTVPLATVSTGLLVDQAGESIEFELHGLEVRGNGMTLSEALLPATDLYITLPDDPTTIIAELNDVSFSLSNLSFGIDSGFSSGAMHFAIASAVLIPDIATPEIDGVATLEELSLTLEPNTGNLDLTAQAFEARFGDYLRVSISQQDNRPVAVRLSHDPSIPLLDLPFVEAAFVGLAAVAGIDEQQVPKMQLEGLQFFADGRWNLTSASLLNAADFVFGVASFLPFAVESIEINHFGQLASGGVDFNQFDLTIGAKAHWESPLFDALPFDPYITVGQQQADQSNDSEILLKVAVASLSEGTLRLVDTGPITLGFRNWEVGKLVLQGELTFGAYDASGTLGAAQGAGAALSGFIAFQTESGAGEPVSDIVGFDGNDAETTPNFERFEETSYPAGATPKADIADDSGIDLSVDGGRLTIQGEVVTDGDQLTAQFDVDLDAGLRFKVADLFELYGVHLDVGFVLSTPITRFEPDMQITEATIAVDAMRLTLGASDPDSTLEFTALGYSIDDVYYPAVELRLIPDAAQPDVLATFGTLGVHFPDILISSDEGGGASSESRIGGRVEGLQLSRNFLPMIDPSLGLQIIGDFGDFFSPENQVFGWLPFRVDSLGIDFDPAFFLHETPTDFDSPIVGIDDPLAFDLIFSGGFVQSEILPGIQFPLEATVVDMPIDVRNLKKFVVDDPGNMQYFPIKLEEIDGVSFGFDPFAFFEDSPLTFRGSFALGALEVEQAKSVYLRLGGEFEFSDWGGGVDVILSDRGPLLTKFNIPLAIPLGQTTLVLSGVEGGISFGVNALRSVTDPLELVSDPVFVQPFDVSTDGIRGALTELLTREAELNEGVTDEAERVRLYTWGQSMTLGVSGSITSVAAAGALSGNATLVANIVWPHTDENGQLVDPDGNPLGDAEGNPLDRYLPDLRLFGTGNIALFGMPMGRAGILLDYSNPLAPSLAFGIAAPAPGSPLEFLLPARAEFGVLLTTDGIYETPLMAVANLVGNGALDVALSPIAARLSSNRSKPLARLLLDTNDDSQIDASEATRTIDAQFIKNRLLGGPANPSGPLLPLSFADFPQTYDATNSDRFIRASRVTTALLSEYLGYLGEEVVSSGQDASAALLSFTESMLHASVDAAVNAWDDFRTKFNPQLVITGKLQPTLLGFPLGTPFIDGTFTLDKTGITVDVQGSLLKILETALDMTTGGLAGTALKYLTLGLEDETQFHYQLEFPTDDVEDIIAALITGSTSVERTSPSGGSFATNLLERIVEVVNPLANWEASLSSEFTLAGLRFANISGVMYGALESSSVGQFGTPLAGHFVFPLDVATNASCDSNGANCMLLVPDGLPDPLRVAALDAYEFALVGSGIADVIDNVTGALVPDGEADPLLIPVPPGDSTGERYRDLMTLGGILLTGQVFVPQILRDPAQVLSSIDWEIPQYDLDELRNDPILAATAAGDYSEWLEAIVTALTAVDEYGRMQTFIPSFASLFDLTGDQQTYGPDGRTDGESDEMVSDTAQDLRVVEIGTMAYLDHNSNEQYDVGADTLLLWSTAEPCVDGDNNKVCEPIDGFIDLNGNTLYDVGVDMLIDIDGNATASNDLFMDLDRDGLFDSGHWYVDRGNGVYDIGELFVDNGNGVHDRAEPFVDDNGNRQWDADESYTDENGNGSYDTGELFVDEGNGVFDPIASVGGRVNYRAPSEPAVIAALQAILDGFYVEGYFDLQMLGIDFGKGYVNLDASGFATRANIPWLADATVESGFQWRASSIKGLLHDLVDSPLVSELVALANVDTGVLQEMLRAGSEWPIPDFHVTYPVGYARGTLTHDGLRQWVRDELGVPSEVFELPPELGFAGTLGFYTPGFDQQTGAVQGPRRHGGIKMTAELSIPLLVENASFDIEMSFGPTDGTPRDSLPVPGALTIPSFTAVAEAELFQLPGFGEDSSLIRFEATSSAQPARIAIYHDATRTTGQLSGRLTVLDTLSLDVDSEFGIDFTPGAAGLWGDVSLESVAGANVITGPGFTLSGDFSLEFNTDAQVRPLDCGTTGSRCIEPGMRLRADAAVLTLPGMEVTGSFALSFDPATNSIEVIAEDIAVGIKFSGADPTPDFEFGSGSGGMRILADGSFAAAIDLQLGARQPAFFQFVPPAGGNAHYQLQVNTTGVTQSGLGHSSLEVAANTIAQIEMNAGINLGGFVADGEFALRLNANEYSLVVTASTEIDLGFLGTYALPLNASVRVDGTSGPDFTIPLLASNSTLPIRLNSNAFAWESSVQGVRVQVQSPRVQFWGTDTSVTPPTDVLIFEVPILDAAGSIEYANGHFQFEINQLPDVLPLWALGNIESDFQALAWNSIGEVELAVDLLGIDLRAEFAGVEVLALAADVALEWDGVIGGLRAELDGALHLFGVPVAAVDYTANLPPTGCLTIEAFNQHYYLNLAQSLVGQNPFDPVTLSSCNIASPLQRTATLVPSLSGLAPDEVTLAVAGSNSRAEVRVNEESAWSVDVDVAGLLPGDSVRLIWEIFEVPSDRATIASLEQAATSLSNSGPLPADFIVRASEQMLVANRTGTITLLDLIDDSNFELNERLGIRFTLQPVAGVDQADVLFDELWINILNDDRETHEQIVHYDFDEFTTPLPYRFDKSADDPNPDGHEGIIASDFTHTDEITPNRALQFDGVNDYAKIVPNAELSTTSFTVEFWMKPEAVTGIEYVVAMGGNYSNTVYVDGATQKIFARFDDWGGQQRIVEIGDYVPHQWQHVAISNASGLLSVFLDGALQSGTFFGGVLNHNDNVIWLGTLDASSTANYTGALDDFRIWQSARTPTEIAGNYLRPLSGSESNLIGYWQFDRAGLTYSTDEVTVTSQTAVLGPVATSDSSETSRQPRWIVGPTALDYSSQIVVLGRDAGLPTVQPDIPVTDLNRIHAVSSNRWRDETAVGPTLVDNGGNEETRSGQPPDGRWVDSSGFWTTHAVTPLRPVTPIEGEQYFHYAVPGGVGTGTLYQDVDLTSFAGKIDRGEQAFWFSANYLTEYQGVEPQATVRFGIEAYDSRGVRIASNTTAPLRSDGQWRLFNTVVPPPPGTRSLRLMLIVTNESRSHGYFDNVNLFALGASKYYQFEVDLSNLDSQERLTLDGMRFFDFADPNGVRTYEVYSSLDDFGTPLAVNAVHVAEYGREEIAFQPPLACLPSELETITFRIHGVGDNNWWRLDNVGLRGAVHNASSHPQGGSCPVAEDLVITTTVDDTIEFEVIASVTASNISLRNTSPPLDVGDVIPLDNLGTLQRTGTGFRFVPSGAEYGQAELQYTIQDDAGRLDIGSVTIIVEQEQSATATLYLPFDSNMLDASSNGNHAILVNTTFRDASVRGPYGNAIELDGVDDAIEFGRHTNLPRLGDDFSVAFWLRVADWRNNEGIVASYSLNNIRWNIGVSDPADALLVRADFGANQFYNVSILDLPNNDFVHFVATFSATGGVERVYVDGTAVAALGTTSFFNYSDPFWFTLGRRETTGANPRYLDGAMDEFLIVDQMLTPSQVRDVWRGDLDAFLATPAATMAAVGISPPIQQSSRIENVRFENVMRRVTSIDEALQVIARQIPVRGGCRFENPYAAHRERRVYRGADRYQADHESHDVVGILGPFGIDEFFADCERGM